MSSGGFQPRRFGAHLLVAQLGEDCLGTVYRALHGSGERRFVRLRVLQSPELSPPAVFAAIARRADQVARLSHKTIVQHAAMSVLDGAPFVAWYEGGGWTLDTVLARLREAGTRLPTAYALLIAERVCAALEHAWFSPFDGEPIRHGLLWPGFVSVSSDAEIRVGGFGLADAILPTLSRGRLARDVAPYAAPEARESGCVEAHSDVYSAGVLLLELLTGRRPTMSAPVPVLGIDDDELPDGIHRLLASCFASPEERPTILEVHRTIQEQLAAGPAPVSTVDLALFLYTLLNPESLSVPRLDGDDTNPIAGDFQPVFDDRTPNPGRRRTDALRIRPEPLVESIAASDEPVFEVVAPSRVPALHPSAVLAPSGRSMRSKGGIRWVSGLAYFGAAAAIILGVEALTIHRDRSVAAGRRASTAAALPAPGAPSPGDSRPAAAGPAPEAAGGEGLVTAQSVERRPSVRAARTKTRDRAGSAADATAVRRAAENARFRAAWARIEAERREAGQLAGDKFGEGRTAELEAQRHFSAGAFDRALTAFEVAASLYREAESASRETRLERLRLASPSS